MIKKILSWSKENQIAVSQSFCKEFLKFSRLYGMFSNTVVDFLLTTDTTHLLTTWKIIHASFWLTKELIAIYLQKVLLKTQNYSLRGKGVHFN